MTINPDVGPVSKVRVIVGRKGSSAYHHANADLIWVKGIPTVVVEWDTSGLNGDVPAVTVPLDPLYLHEIGWAEAKYMYEFAIQDPRALD